MFYDVDRVSVRGSVVLERERTRLARDNAARRDRLGFAQNSQQSSSSMTPAEFSMWLQGVKADVNFVDEVSAMACAPIYACVQLLGGATASLPLKFYRETKGNPREQYKPDEWWFFNEQCCSIWAAAPAWEFAVQSLTLQGDSFWRLLRASRLSPTIVGVEPLHPLTVEVFRQRNAPRMAYRVNPQPSDQGVGTVTTYDQDDILHIPGPGFNGLRGMSQIMHALRIPGNTALQAGRYQEAFFRNSARPDYAMQTDRNLDAGQIKTIRDQLVERHQSASKAFLPIVLHGGLKIEPITMKPEEAQLVEQMRLPLEDCCRIMGVPPFMIGSTDKVTAWGTGLEQIGIGFRKYSLGPRTVKFEQEINRKLFRNSGRFCEFDFDGLERSDVKTRTTAYRTALGRAGEPAWMLPEEIRARENLPIDEETMAELDALNQSASKAAPPGGAAPAPDPNADPNVVQDPNADPNQQGG